MTRRMLSSLLFAASLVPLPLLAQGGPGPHGRHDCAGGGPPVYDVAAERTLAGTVAEVLPQNCPRAGIHVRLSTPEGEIEVGLGPVAYLGELGANFATGDAIEVTGAAPKTEAPADFLARSVKKGEATYLLRNEQGAPLWPRGAMDGPRHGRRCAGQG
jgi:hypothetical protein